MAPPVKPFPVSELEQRIQTQTVNFREKSRKLPRDFKLKDCELFELVQYSCTTSQQQMENALKSDNGKAQIECFPFVRLFRRCKHGEKTFHVETTAWEGQHAWHPKSITEPEQRKSRPDLGEAIHNTIAEYGNYFWSKK